MADVLTRPADPREANIKPPVPGQHQPSPGSEAQINPKADHGEESYHGHNRLEGKAALITGADSGIGRAVAIAFAKEGADVVISYLPEEEQDAQETASQVQKAGRKAVTVACDITDAENCRKLVETTVQQLGKLDILVNNAGFQRTHEKLAEFTPEEIERTYKTNIFAMFYLSQAAEQHMQPGSAIINTASIEAFEPKPSLLAYASTKAAIVNFTKGLAKLLAAEGIRVNAVAPGPVWTPLIPSTMPEEQVKQFGKSSAFGRPAQPVEMAPLYVLLASEDASYVTGEVYGATGGKMPV